MKHILGSWRGLWAPAAALLLMAASAPAYDVQYTVLDLGTLGGPISQSWGVNNSGVVVGQTLADVTHGGFLAFSWNNGMVELLPLPGAPHAVAFAINDAGMAVGASFSFGDLNGRATLWSGGAPIELGSFLARDISPNGTVIGTALVDGGGGAWFNRAVRWRDGQLSDLGTLGGDYSTALAIDPTNQRIVGSSTTAGNAATHACLWQGGAAIDLGTLGGNNSQASDVNDAGQIVGTSDLADGRKHGVMFVVDAGGNVLERRDLGELGSGTSAADAVNHDGVAVGVSDGRATVWKSGAPLDLNTLIEPGQGWQLGRAVGVNDLGYIVGTGRLDGAPRAFMLKPSAGVDCGAIAKFAAKCANGKLVAKVKSTLPAGTELTVDNSGDLRTIVIDDRGRGKAKYKGQSGLHTVTLVECPTFSASADCG